MHIVTFINYYRTRDAKKEPNERETQSSHIEMSFPDRDRDGKHIVLEQVGDQYIGN